MRTLLYNLKNFKSLPLLLWSTVVVNFCYGLLSEFKQAIKTGYKPKLDKASSKEISKRN